MSQPIIVIPARLASGRLPGKPLAVINGVAMIVHVWQRAIEAGLGPVLVATGDPEIAGVIAEAGGVAIATRPDHACGSDRVHEAVEQHDTARRFDIVINLQGDLPTIGPDSIRSVLAPLSEAKADIATLVTETRTDAERIDPNIVKCIGSLLPSGHLRALYFSRAAAPWGDGPLYHHIGIYAYRRAALDYFARLSPSPLEKREKLEQLRALEAGMRIDAALIETSPIGVDAPDTLEQARDFLRPK
jgi:3-deoxy-manno-octulosonate cytidylyltransferase (CMP-KDO synthetase)